MEAFVARQAIFDQQKHVVAYELLHRSSTQSPICELTDGNLATRFVVAHSLLSGGLDKLSSKRPAFINFTRELLLQDFGLVLPKDGVVIEVLEGIVPDSDVLGACRRLKENGYRIALDDVVCLEDCGALIKLADFVKVDFRLTTMEKRRSLARSINGRKIALLAEKVETDDEFEEARRQGYSHFQGFFFARPKVIETKQPPAFKLHYQRLLAEVHSGPLNFKRLDGIIRQELSLTYALLRYINAGRFAWSHRIESVQHALVLLGEEEIRRWTSLAILTAMAADQPEELVVLAMVRARFAEQLAPSVNLEEHASELFLIGLFSSLDAIMSRPLKDVLAEISPGECIMRVLMGSTTPNEPRAIVYQIVRAYEAGEWQRVSDLARAIGVDEPAVSTAYQGAVMWADAIFRP
jgi:EAL and modified HD-GYP domain-containing signal transduction protein